MKTYSWKGLIWIAFLIYLPIIFVGLLIGHIIPLLLISLIIHIIWHYYYLNKLNDFLWNRKSTILPDGSAEWEHAYIGIHNMQQRDRKRRKKLADVITRFRQGNEALPDAVVVFHKLGNIIWCNRLAKIQLGLRWPEDNGEYISNLIRNPAFIEYLRKDSFDESIELPSPNNINKLLEFRVIPYAADQRLLIVRDVTMYRQVDVMRQEFVSNVAHELRTPLTVLQGYIEILQMQTDPDSQQVKTVDVLDKQTKRMCSLVEQLMVLSKIESADHIDFNEVINVAALLAQIEDETTILVDKKGLDIKFKVDKKLYIYGNQIQFRSAMANLIYNAIYYTPEGGCITVEWSRRDLGGYFCVTDNGDGIAPEHIYHLTERFYRVDESRSRDTGGSGLGLSIVKHVLTHYDSELTIESQLYKGSKFSFIIPLDYLSS